MRVVVAAFNQIVQLRRLIVNSITQDDEAHVLRRECRKWAIRVAREAKAINDIEKRLSVLKGIIFSSFILILASKHVLLSNNFKSISVHPIQFGSANHVKLKADYWLFLRFQIVDNEDIFLSISIT